MKKIIHASLAALLVVSTFATTTSSAFAERKHKQTKYRVIAAADQGFQSGIECHPEGIIAPVILGAVLGAGIGAVAGAIAYTTIPIGTVALGAGAGAGVGVVSHKARC